MTGSQARRVKLLDWLYDYPGDVAGIVDFLGQEPDELTENLWRGTLRALDKDGLIRLAETMGFAGTSAFITDGGRAEVEARRARRENPALRRAAAANGLLRWLYEQDPYGESWSQIDQIESTDYAVFEGGQLPAQLFRRVADHLHGEGLLVAGSYVAEFDGPLTAQLTRRGQECVEIGADVAEYLNRTKEQPTNVTHFHGPVSGSNVSWASAHVTQTATTTGIASDELGVLLRAIAEALPVLGLSNEQAAAVQRNAEIIEGELQQSDPDKHVVKTMLMRTADTIVGAGNSALGLVLTGYAKELMKKAGISIE
ncbi:hypothetical protein E1193_15240 [Micromonospora sp. KC606]|uniref:hypothetical protein n=1 Tax=Micromonospora sp. KC606 TaxID=2530379 RepID=UPI0010512262|nr:hypothetical protein [Micromonospora sp. KC606]TDC81265.1 hypothetical protein E1193_15240 [Micromonospora sp. KC606]